MIIISDALRRELARINALMGVRESSYPTADDSVRRARRGKRVVRLDVRRGSAAHLIATA